MRKEFIAKSDSPNTYGYETASTMAEAQDIAPWSSVIVEVQDGHIAFESHYDHQVWMNQST